jgi:flagellar FliL protein
MAEDAKGGEKKKKGRSKLLLLGMVGVLVVGLGGGAGAYWFMSRGSHDVAAKDGAHPAPPPEEHAEDPAVVSLPTFTVNLADKDGSRYLRVTLSLAIPDHDAAEQIGATDHGPNAKMARARSAILELLTTKTAEELTTAEGKQRLKKEIGERATKALGRVKVSDVLFSEFVVQY